MSTTVKTVAAVRPASIACLSLVLVLAAGCSSNQAARDARVDALFEPWRKTSSPGCGVGVGQNGATVLNRAYGMASLELGVPITQQSVFSSASISKQFTAMSILLLVQRGLVRLDDPVRMHLPEFPGFDTPITIRHLLNHTSGIREGFGLDGWTAARDDGSDPNDAILRVLSRQRGVNVAPGTQYQYNNGGYNLLAHVVRRKTGKSLRAFADEHIVDPLEMTQSYFLDDATEVVPHHVSNYWQGADGWHLGSEVLGVVGNAGFHTTVTDLLRWADNFRSVRVGTPELLQLMRTPATLTDGTKTGYGLGVNVGEYRGRRTIEHGGGDRGISTYLLIFPDDQTSIVILCNSDAIPSGALAQQVADIYLEDRLTPHSAAPENAIATKPAIVSLPPAQLAGKAGWYRDPSSGDVLKVELREGRLEIRDVEGDDMPYGLEAVDPRQFVIAIGNVVVNRISFEGSDPATPRAMRIQPVGIEGPPQILERLAQPGYPAAELQAFAGEYYSDELDVVYRVEPRGSGLVLRPMGRRDMALDPVSADRFAGSSAGIVLFSRERGAVSGFTLNRRTARGVEFRRARPD